MNIFDKTLELQSILSHFNQGHSEIFNEPINNNFNI